MGKVRVFCIKNCHFCVVIKNFLSKQGVGFEEIDITNNEEEWDRLFKETKGWRTVPMIFVDDQFIGGHIEAQKYFSDPKNLSPNQ